MSPILIACALAFLHILAVTWLNSWVYEATGISDEAYNAKCAELEAQEAKAEPNKFRRLFQDSTPQQRELRRWIEENAADPVLFKRRSRVCTLAELPVVLFAVRFLLGETEFLGCTPMGAMWFWTWLIYDLVILITGVIYSRIHK